VKHHVRPEEHRTSSEVIPGVGATATAVILRAAATTTMALSSLMSTVGAEDEVVQAEVDESLHSSLDRWGGRKSPGHSLVPIRGGRRMGKPMQIQMQKQM
jgi:hypothetical protein